MPGLAFLHPALLWGLALAGLPVLIHLLQRRRHRVRRWAAMEFLRASVRRSSRRLRIEQWLLLLVRALILILAALALARPVWSTHSFGAGTRPHWGWLGSRAAAQVVLVLDDSYGMAWHPDGAAGPHPTIRNPRSQFDQARSRALELIRDGLAPGDSVSLILASAPARAPVRRPTFNLKAIAAQLEDASPSDRPADLDGAAQLCLQVLRASHAATQEVYLLTNAQAVDWQQPDAVTAWRRVAAAAHLYLVPTSPARGANWAVDEVRVDAPVAAGRLTPVEARISHWGEQPSPGVVVTLHADGQAVASTRIDLPARGSVEAGFEHTFTTPGPHTVMVSLPGDGLAVDDRGYAGVLARDHPRVLLLNGRPDPDPRRDAAFFTAAALAPAGWSEVGSWRTALAPSLQPPSPSSDPFAVQVLDGSSFRDADLSGWDVVVLADVPRLAEPERRRLASFVANGGGLLILPGEAALPAFYNGDLMARSPALMPARLGPAVDAGADAPALDLARVDHPALVRFRDAADVDLTTARFERYFRLRPLGADSSARILCRFTDGSPALAERAVGLGRVALLAAPLLPGWTTLPFKPAFLPFLDGLVDYLGQGPNSRRNLRVGDPLVWAIPNGAAPPAAGAGDPPSGAAILDEPGGDRLTLPYQQMAVGPVQRRVVRLDSVPRAGLYRLQTGVQAHSISRIPYPAKSKAGSPSPNTQHGARSAPERPNTDWIGVNLNTVSSDLRTLDRAGVEGLVRPAPFRWVDPHEGLAAALREGRQGREAWRGLLLAAMALMLCESAMAQRFGRRRGDG